MLVAIGLIPATVAGRELGIGGECVGKIAAVGEGVTGFSVGDEVVALPPDGFGLFTTTSADFVLLKPANISSSDAVGISLAFGTAWLALIEQARIRKGERVLIHSAAGGVGLAAVQIALMEGAEVYATASSEEKRDYLRSIGVSHVYHSRSIAFAKEIANDCKHGVDVVLNSLAGEPMRRSIELLSPFGRFIEIGKRDQYEHTAISLAPFLRGLTYSAAHLDVLMLEYPLRARKVLLDVWAAVAQGTLRPLPSQVFPISSLRDALEYMSLGAHTGKLLIHMESAPALLKQREVVFAHPAPNVPSAMNYLIIISLCGPLPVAFLALIHRIVSCGRRVTVLAVGRADQLTCERKFCQEGGASLVRVVQDASEVAHALSHIGTPDCIVHLVHETDSTSYESDLQSLIALHAYALDFALKSYITIVSAAPALLGGVPNRRSAIVHALAEHCTGHRRKTGCHSRLLRLSAGTLPKNVRSIGAEALTPAALIRVYEMLIASTELPACISVVNGDLHKAAAWERSAMLGTHIRLQAKSETSVGSTADVAQVSLRERAGRWLHTYAADHSGQSEIDPSKPFETFGLDSLGLMQMLHRLQHALSITLSLMDLYDHPTIEKLAAFIERSNIWDASQERSLPDHEAIVSATAPTMPTGPDAPRNAWRVLCLHGFRTNADLFRMQMRGVEQQLHAVEGTPFDFSYIDAPHPISGSAPPGLPAAMLPSLREWWSSDGTDTDNSYENGWRSTSCVGIERSIEYCEQYIRERGPFDVIVGFSQGAAMAGILVGRRQVPEQNRPPRPPARPPARPPPIQINQPTPQDGPVHDASAECHLSAGAVCLLTFSRWLQVQLEHNTPQFQMALLFSAVECAAPSLQPLLRLVKPSSDISLLHAYDKADSTASRKLWAERIGTTLGSKHERILCHQSGHAIPGAADAQFHAELFSFVQSKLR